MNEGASGDWSEAVPYLVRSILTPSRDISFGHTLLGSGQWKKVG
jgi:hypothetical protein